MVRRFFTIVSLILVLSFTGCMNRSPKTVITNQGNTSSITNSIQETKGQSTTPLYSIKSSLPIVSLKDAWNNANIKSIDCMLQDKRGWFPLSMSNDGVIVATVPSQNNKPEEVILYNSINNTYTSISKLNKESQHGSADINDQWVVWTESLDQSFGKYMHIIGLRIKIK